MSEIWGLVAIGVCGVIGLAAAFIAQAKAQSTGVQLQAAATTATTAAAETAIATAEVAAPTSQAALVDRIKAGTF